MAVATASSVPSFFGAKDEVDATVESILDSYGSLFREEIQKVQDAKKQLESAVTSAERRMETELNAIKHLLTREGYAGKQLLLRRNPSSTPAAELVLERERATIHQDQHKKSEELQRREEEQKKREEEQQRKERELNERESNLAKKEAELKAQAAAAATLSVLPPPVSLEVMRSSKSESVLATERKKSSSSKSSKKKSSSKSAKKSSKKSSKKSKKDLSARGLGRDESISEDLHLSPEEALVVRSIVLEEDYLRKMSNREIIKLLKGLPNTSAGASGGAPKGIEELDARVRAALLLDGPTNDEERAKLHDAKLREILADVEVQSNTPNIQQVTTYLQQVIDERKKKTR